MTEWYMQKTAKCSLPCLSPAIESQSLTPGETKAKGSPQKNVRIEEGKLVNPKQSPSYLWRFLASSTYTVVIYTDARRMATAL
jgi:hypothetical protein